MVEFPGVWDLDDFGDLIDSIMMHSDANKPLAGGRHGFYREEDDAVVVYNPNDPDCGTAWYAEDARYQFEHMLK